MNTNIEETFFLDFYKQFKTNDYRIVIRDLDTNYCEQGNVFTITPVKILSPTPDSRNEIVFETEKSYNISYTYSNGIVPPARAIDYSRIKLMGLNSDTRPPRWEFVKYIADELPAVGDRTTPEIVNHKWTLEGLNKINENVSFEPAAYRIDIEIIDVDDNGVKNVVCGQSTGMMRITDEKEMLIMFYISNQTQSREPRTTYLLHSLQNALSKIGSNISNEVKIVAFVDGIANSGWMEGSAIYEIEPMKNEEVYKPYQGDYKASNPKTQPSEYYTITSKNLRDLNGDSVTDNEWWNDPLWSYDDTNVSIEQFDADGNPELNMGHPETLRNYIRYVKSYYRNEKNYTFKNNSLIIAGHGIHITKREGYYESRSVLEEESKFCDSELGYDTSSTQDAFYAQEFKKALSNFTGSNKIGFFLYEGCQMSTVEFAYSLKNNVRFFCASPDGHAGDNIRTERWMNTIINLTRNNLDSVSNFADCVLDKKDSLRPTTFTLLDLQGSKPDNFKISFDNLIINLIRVMSDENGNPDVEKSALKSDFFLFL